MIIATAGHIDHGKTLLVKTLTGVDTDRLPEEKARGLTIDLGFAYQPLGENGAMVGFVDVPGHERFIRNMLAGVTNIDYALFVIAADDGAMPQTLEHLAILDLLGAYKGVVALTKIDRVDADRVAEVSTQIENLLSTTKLAGIEIMPVSAITGDGIEDLKANLELAAEENKARASDRNFRLSVDRCFTIPGAGIVATGTVFSGKISDDEHAILSPEGIEVRIRRIHAQNMESKTGQAGQRCAINIAGRGLRKVQVHRGDWLVAENAHNPTSRFDARIKLLPGEPRSLKHWTPVHVHLGAGDVPGRVAVLEGRSIEPGDQALVQIVFDRRLNIVKGDKFILRDQTARRTMAGGLVIDPFPPARGRTRPERLALVKAMESPDPRESLLGSLDHLPAGLDLNQFSKAWNLTPDEAAVLWDQTDMVQTGTDEVHFAFSSGHWESLKNLCLSSLESWHKAKPDSPGLTLANLRSSLSTRIPVLVFATLIDHMVRDGKTTRNGETASLTAHSAQMAPEDNALWKNIEPLINSGGLRPPIVHEIAAETGQPPKKVEGFLKRMTKQGRVLQVASNRFYPPDAVESLAKIALSISKTNQNGWIDVRAFRDQAGIGRNLAIEVLEYFDKLGFTHRTQDGRKVIKPMEDIFGGK